METNKKNYTGFAVAIIILVSLVILLTGYIVYDKFFKANDNFDELSLVKEDINDLVKLLNSDTAVDETNACTYFGNDLFGAKDKDWLDDIAPYLMACKYNMKYDVRDSVLYNLYTMDENKYNLFRDYFNVEIEKTDNYYLAYGAGDGFAIRQYDFEIKTDLDKLVASNGLYTIEFNVNSIHDKSLVGIATLKVSVKEDHLYYDSFTFEENIDVETLGMELFNKYRYKNHYYLFSNINLNYDNLYIDRKLEMALMTSSNLIYNKNFIYDINNMVDEYQQKDYYFKLLLSDFIENYQSLFGKDYKIDVNYFDYFIVVDDYPMNCFLESEEIRCYPFEGGETWSGQEYINYNYSKMNDNKLEVYVDYLSIDAPYNFHICSDFGCNNIIDNSVTESVEKINETELFEKYKDKTGIYKMVFEKDTDGNYYWVETDVVKK